MAGHTAPAVFARLNCEIIPLFFELDGTFPNHEANPIDAKNLKDLRKRSKSTAPILDLLSMATPIVASWSMKMVIWLIHLPLQR
jgi:phosphomannomutase